MAKFFVTTPIYYSNAPVHLGHAYTSIAADVLARWNRLNLGAENVFFLTGLDEHGGHIERVAREQGKTPQALVDEMAVYDRKFFDDLGISYDDFIRTTEDRHRIACEEFWKRVYKNGDLKPGTYEGLYCGSCEAYYQEEELPGGKCPVHQAPVEAVKEDTFFFRLSNYKEFLEKHYRDRENEELYPGNPGFVIPDVRANEMKNLIRELRDISVTRTKVKWGFKVPDHPHHVIYVWFDALINYLTAIGFPDPKYERFWGQRDETPGDDRWVVHIVGKEINRFHALLWPAMLESAGLRLPDRIAAHGWWTVEGEKMSKSRGNVIDPRGMAAKYSTDALRYYLLREIPFGNDGDFSEQKFKVRYNADLANDFGNLVHRTIAMSFRYFKGKIKNPSGVSPWDGGVVKKWPAQKEKIESIAKVQSLSFVQAAFVFFAENGLKIPQYHDTLHDIWEMIKDGNMYLNEKKPWGKPPVSDPEATLGQVLVLLEAASWPLLAFLPAKAAKLREQLGLDPQRRQRLPDVFTLTQGDPLFPRIDTKKD